MQRFVRKLVTRHQHYHHHNLSHSAFTSLPKPKPSQLRHHIDISTTSLTPQFHHFHSCRPHRFISTPIRGASNLRNALLRSLLHFPRAYFHKQSFPSNQTSNFHLRSWISWIHRLTPDNMVSGLIKVNVAVFLLWRIAGEKFMKNNFTISLDNIKSGRLHTLITSAFSHIETGHLISNMLGLYFFGMNLIGRNFGPEFLLKLYLVGAVVGSVFYLMHQYLKAQTSKDSSSSKDLALGASGTVNAIIVLDIFLAALYLDFCIPIPVVLLGIYLIRKDMRMVLEGNSRVSGAAHLGGAVGAAIAWAGVRKGRF